MKQHSFSSNFGLPDAPMAMPKQRLERDRSLVHVLVDLFLGRQRG